MTPLGVHVVIVRFGKVLQVGIVMYDLFAKSRVSGISVETRRWMWRLSSRPELRNDLAARAWCFLSRRIERSSTDGRNININDIAQRQCASANYIQKDVEVYVEFMATGYTAKKDHGSSLKLLSIGLLDDGTAGYNFESPSKKRRTQ